MRPTPQGESSRQTDDRGGGVNRPRQREFSRVACPAPMLVRRLPAVVPALAAALLVSGCAALPFGARPSAPPPAGGRPADSLLARTDLQRIVDLQVRREGRTLAGLLGSTDARVRARAAFALGSVQDSTAVDALARALADPAPLVRADAAFALGQTADSTAAPALLAALRTEATEAVRTELLDAVGKVGGRADLDGLLGLPLPPTADASRTLAVARMVTRGVVTPAVWTWLSDRLAAPGLAEHAAYAFARTPAVRWTEHDPAVRAAFDRSAAGALAGDAALPRMHLARALGRVGDAQDVPRLAAALAGDPDWRVRQAAAGALGAPALVTLPAAREALWGGVADDQTLVAMTAAEVLARPAAPATDASRAQAVVGGRAPWPVQAALLPLLARAGQTAAVEAWAARQTSPFARAASVSALGAARDGASRDRLLDTVNDADPRIAAAAVEALRARWEAEPDRAGTAAGYFEAFAGALRRADLATTSAAAPALADSAFAPLGGPSVLREVYARLRAPVDVEPMVEIVRAIGETRDGQEVEFLVGVALDGHPAVRAAARDALNERLVEGIDVSLLTGREALPPTTTVDWTHLRRVGPRPRLILETDRGQIVVEMDAEAAPQTVQMLTSTASAGDYDGVPFHRVVPNFVAQGGDFFRADGYGGPEVSLRSEFGRARYRTGTVGMASAGKDTEGVQFFITHSPQPHLDGRYTVVGRVVEGQDVADRLVPGDRIRRARVQP